MLFQTKTWIDREMILTTDRERENVKNKRSKEGGKLRERESDLEKLI